jgi:hypothetical protein
MAEHESRHCVWIMVVGSMAWHGMAWLEGGWLIIIFYFGAFC